MSKVYITSDLHFGHKNILKYCPNRIDHIKTWARENGVMLTSDNIIECMDNWLIDLWNSQVNKDDTVYVLGDFSFHPAEYNKKILSKLNGNKFLILGNHDGNSDSLDKLKSVFSQLFNLAKPYKTTKFATVDEANEFLDKLNAIIVSKEAIDSWFEQITQIKELKYKDESGETFCFELCHYPMVTWNRKEHGTMNIHGHSHGNLDGYNEESSDLRVDVGIDSKLANYRFLTPDELLVYFYDKAGTKDFKRYNEACREREKQKTANHTGIFAKIHKWMNSCNFTNNCKCAKKYGKSF